MLNRLAQLLLVLSAALGVSLWWAVHSQTAFEWAVAAIVQRFGGVVVIEGVHGTLAGPVRFDRLVYRHADTRITLEEVSAMYALAPLARGRLAFSTLDAALLRIDTAPSTQPDVPPDTLALPVEIAIEKGAIGRVELNGARANDLTFSYSGGREGHRLRGVSFTSDYGAIAGDGEISGARPFALAGAFTLRREDGLSASAELSGDLMAIGIAAQASAGGARAQGTVRLAPFAPARLVAFSAHGENIDLALWHDAWPRTQLVVDSEGSGDEKDQLHGHFSVRNLLPGTLTAGRLPLRSIVADYASEPDALNLTRIEADLGTAGEAHGTAHLSSRATQLDVAVTALNLRGIHAPLRATRLAGRVAVHIAGSDQKLRAQLVERGISFDLEALRRGDVVTLKQFRIAAGSGVVSGSGSLALERERRFAATAALARIDPSQFGDFPPASLNGSLKISGALAPQWQAAVELMLTSSLYRGVKLGGQLAGIVSENGVRNADIALAAGANTLRAQGSFGRPDDALEVALDASRLAQLDPRLAGSLRAKGRLGGDYRQPQFEAEVTGSGLAWRQSTRVEALRAHVAGTLAQHVITAQARSDPYEVAARLEGGYAPSGWSGTIVSLQNSGRYPAALTSPMPLAASAKRLAAGPGELRFEQGRLALGRFVWENGKIDTRGELANVPIAPFLAFAGPALSSRSDLRIGGRWSVAATPRLNGEIELRRESGDLVLGGDIPLALQLEAVSVSARFSEDRLDASFDAAARSGRAQGTIATSGLERDAALKLEARIALQSLRLLDPFITTHAVLTGRADAVLAASGTIGAPRFTGTLAGEELAIDAPQYGVRLRDGSLRAVLTESAVEVRAFTMRADEGRLTATGRMPLARSGETKLEWRAEQLRLLGRPDMRLKVDGEGTVARLGDKLVLRGAIKAEEGYFEFDQPAAPKLGEDVVVLGRPQPPATRTRRAALHAAALDVNILLDLGDRLHLVGAGLETDLRGRVRLSSSASGVLEARGSVTSVNGVYYAFGQRLAVERGRLIFDGPLDNPALDIVAMRRNLQVEAGVAVTGTVRVPNVRLVSEPPVSDSEKLAWLTLGHGLEDASGADLLLLQTAAASLMGGGDKLPLTRRLANRVGLDDIAVRGRGGLGGQVVALGKRLSDKLYVEYQQGLSATSTAVRLSYVLTRWLSLRAETGSSSGVGLYFQRSFD